MAKFSDWKVRPKGICISEDLAEETRRRRKDKLNKLKEAKAQGKIAYFVLDKLVIRKRPRSNFSLMILSA